MRYFDLLFIKKLLKKYNFKFLKSLDLQSGKKISSKSWGALVIAKKSNSMSTKKKIAIFIDSRKKSGGAYQEFLYTLKNIKEFNNERYRFVVISASKELDFSLDNEKI